MYFNFDELPDEQTLAASLKPIRRFKNEGLEVKVAMQNDVNGIGWCLNDYYNDLGVKYLNMGTHGHRALIAFDKPTLFLVGIAFRKTNAGLSCRTLHDRQHGI
jgi:alpha-mannosidase